MEGFTSEPSKSPTPQAGSPQQSQNDNEGESCLDQQMSTSPSSNSTLLAKENQVADENSKWVQRATWKSLVGADGWAASLLNMSLENATVISISKEGLITTQAYNSG